VKGKARCRLHGGRSTGPRTEEGLKRIRAARMVHGRYSAIMTELRRAIADERRINRELLRWVEVGE
jgi:hypothetical protein